MTKAQNKNMETKIEKQFVETKLTRTGQRPLVFMGLELASENTRTSRGETQNRWSKCSVYETEKGKFVVGIGRITCWQGESDHYTATVLESLDDAVKLLESEEPALAQSIAETLEVAERI